MSRSGAWTGNDGMSLRRELAATQKFQCIYCRGPLTMKGTGVTRATLDHRVPLARGGSNGRENLVVCCQRCNNKKGSLTDLEFVELVRRGRHGF